MAVLPVPSVLPDSTLAPRAVMRKFAMAGVGDLPDCVEVDPGIPCYSSSDSGSYFPSYPPVQSGSSSSDAWASLLAALARGGLDIAKLQVIQPGTVMTPGGISMQNPGYPVTGTLGGASAGIAGSLTSLLPIVLIGGLVIMMVGKK